MGCRTFQEQIIIDELRQGAFKMASIHDVADKLDYIQHLNALDHKPTSLGGRNNGWREITMLRISTN
jgi:hypothetical protein